MHKMNEPIWAINVRFAKEKRVTKIGIVKRKQRGCVYYDLVADTGRDVSCKCGTFDGACHAVWALYGKMIA